MTIRRILVLFLAICLFLTPSCNATETQNNTSDFDAFDFSLGQYLADKTYDEIVQEADLTESDAAYMGGGQAFDSTISYGGEEFQLVLNFYHKADVSVDPAFYLGVVRYNLLYTDNSDSEKIYNMISSLYNDFKAKYGEPTDELLDDIGPALATGNFEAFRNASLYLEIPVPEKDNQIYTLSISSPLPTQTQISVSMQLTLSAMN